ncbi:hypothetical protein DOTSEDRAFT_48191 [Dothistroma septosporum NZE10]|uniref:Uncharacterized protein n=1 Tax=Dothistroma septosporum (strain NZE10 / CBS 128990) TaxID=675120 RepID=M2WI30_DOTSN|nr:hypothetical protein DOTSEDRAFT_48191 [Dothistroma septosporum NZE10]
MRPAGLNERQRICRLAVSPVARASAVCGATYGPCSSQEIRRSSMQLVAVPISAVYKPSSLHGVEDARYARLARLPPPLAAYVEHHFVIIIGFLRTPTRTLSIDLSICKALLEVCCATFAMCRTHMVQ